MHNAPKQRGERSPIYGLNRYFEVLSMTKILRELKHLVLLSVGALVFLVGAVTVQAATYYVATTGNDTHACATAQTISTPLRTIASGVACLNPGDTLPGNPAYHCAHNRTQ